MEAAFPEFAGPCGVVSIVSASVSKKLSTKVSKHEKMFSLATSKGDYLNSLVLKALNDSKVTDDELHLIKIAKLFNTDF